MSKSTVAQEPSMDEILASIRRIIETGEDRTSLAPRPEEPAADTPPERPVPSSARLPDRFDARDLSGSRRAPNPVLAAAASDVSSRITASVPEAKSLSESSASATELDDEARLTADLEQELAASWGQPATEAERQPEPDVTIPPELPSPTEGPQTMSDLPSFDRRNDPPSSPAAETRPEPAPVDRGGFSPANSDRPLASSEERYEAVTLPLTSETTSTLVAASFSDLAQAIRSGELRSIEAMAQEMLRPMLQEWLDDNLPRMVERLVREEIERMSRGGRR
ncbi:DUF2497 domain-containing protein [Aureimonas jatrophae]|nr:DUF2497 domain-containing protein [Aureimonas jatrophae]MBB3951232.1 hypothetical protein [Aureimonas jatrophae]